MQGVREKARQRTNPSRSGPPPTLAHTTGPIHPSLLSAESFFVELCTSLSPLPETPSHLSLGESLPPLSLSTFPHLSLGSPCHLWVSALMTLLKYPWATHSKWLRSLLPGLCLGLLARHLFTSVLLCLLASLRALEGGPLEGRGDVLLP